MEQKLLEHKGAAAETVVSAEPVRPKISIAQVTAKLEAGEINPATLDKKTITQCIVYFISRGYSAEEIGPILNVSSRTIYRRMKKARSENSIKFGIEFQKDFVQDFMNSTNAQYRRMLRLSYSDDLTDYEKAKMIFILNKLELDRMALLEKLGYLSRENATLINAIDADEYIARDSAEGQVAEANKEIALSSTEKNVKLLDMIIKMIQEKSEREEDLYA